MKTDTGKRINREFFSGPLFQTEKKIRREQLPLTSNEIQPKNRHSLRGLDGKYGRWGEILRDILNSKLKMQNRKKTDTDTEEDNDDDEEEMPEVTRRQAYDTSERNGRYAPIQTNPEDGAVQIHTDEEMSGENTESIIRRFNRNIQKPSTYGCVPYTRNIWG